jgi:hypothetical protein
MRNTTGTNGSADDGSVGRSIHDVHAFRGGAGARRTQEAPMHPIWSIIRRAFAALPPLLVLPTVATAQFIALKTLPVATGDQFMIFPSENVGMGNVSIALDDALLDPFVNPAKTSRLTRSLVFATPTFYSISNNAGNARSLPAGALFNGKGWFGGGVVALQQLERQEFFGPVPFCCGPENLLSERSATNKYAYLNFGRLFPVGLALAGSAFYADLSAVDGVEHLYAGAVGIDQWGGMADFRIGLTKEWAGGRVAEAVILHNRFDMDHDVAYIDWVLVDSVQWPEWRPETRTQHNRDVTRTWGLHLGYVQPIGTNGWRVGGILTANLKSHPKIPSYVLEYVPEEPPKDPGNSSAFDIGVGFSRTTEQTTFGIDLVYQPAFSDTWAEADSATETVQGDTIPAGGKLIENTFRFGNAFLGLGVTQRVGVAAFQLGLQVRAYDYHLDQWNNVEETSRRQDEQWMEWAPSWGVSVRLTGLELRYRGRVTSGTGRPGVARDQVFGAGQLDFAPGSDIVWAPDAPLTLQDATVTTHQVSVSVPIK